MVETELGLPIGRGATPLAPKARLLKPSRASPHHPGMIEVKKVGDRPIKHFRLLVSLPAAQALARPTSTNVRQLPFRLQLQGSGDFRVHVPVHSPPGP